MKHHILAAFLLISTFVVQNVSAQKSFGNISLSAGYSLPVGKFANATPGDPLAK